MNGDDDWKIRGSGVQQEMAISAVRGKLIDTGPGEHLWVIVCTHLVTEPSRAQDQDACFNLDLENLADAAGPLCFKCEQSWSAELEAALCPGSVEEPT